MKNQGVKKLSSWVMFGVTLILQTAYADVVADWNIKAGEVVVEGKLGPPPANRVMAIAHTAVYEAVNAITKRYPASGMNLAAAAGASVDAAVAAANRNTLAKLVPSQQAAVDSAYTAALAKIADDAAKTDGVALGEKAADAVLAMRAAESVGAGEAYRPFTTAGVYVPTVIPAASQWSQRKPWLMTSSAQFRPAPPPALNSALWARDYNEVKAFGGRNSTSRSAEQTAIARFWESTLPPIYHGVLRSVANMPGREVTQNARFFAAATQAADDALMAVFEAKYAYNFWRPVTAIRNGAMDGNDATEADAAWNPYIDTPMHPEYPCAHCIMSSTVGTVIQAELGSTPPPMLTTNSPTANGAARSWSKVEDYMQEVANARIYDGVHYRNSTEVGTAMGKQIGALSADKYLKPNN